ncbi:MAG: MOSC N-terminal beta barrel domain-containing protein [Ilumatobacter sp.]
MRVEEIWRYPVKSTGGERLIATAVDERGIEFDRAWGIFDHTTGLVLTGRREPALLFLSSRVVDGRPVITTEDGEDVSSDESLSAHLSRPVELHSAADGPATFENPINIDDETDWFQWQSAGRSFHDGRSTISFGSRESLRDWDSRRFRLNLIVDGDDEEEPTGEVLVGSVALTIRKPIERCIMVSRPQPGLERDLGVLKTVIRELDNQLGVGAVVSSAGTIAVGDEFRS